MPLLSYTAGSFPFQPFTKILSADVVQCFNDVKTLLNTTKIDSTNVQQYGLTRDRMAADAPLAPSGTPSSVVINDSSNHMTNATTLATTLGGTGVSYTVGSGVAGDIPQVNLANNAIVWGQPPAIPPARVFNYLNF